VNAPPAADDLWRQVAWLWLLAIPIASVSWTVTHEEVFREVRDYCSVRSRDGRSLARRKFFYLFTCEYCFSHYVTVLFLWLTGYRLLLDDWRGLLIAGFALAGVANVYLSLYGRVRVEIKAEHVDIAVKEQEQNSTRATPSTRTTR
jgi:hypothetical protein